MVLKMDAAAARRKQGRLPTQSWWGEGDPPGQRGWMSEGPLGDAVLLTPTTMGPRMLVPRSTQPPPESLPEQPDLARDPFEMHHRRPGPKRRRSPQNNEQTEPDFRSGMNGIGDGRKRGKIGARLGVS